MFEFKFDIDNYDIAPILRFLRFTELNLTYI